MFLTIAAIIPVIYIAYQVYRSDTEKEPISLLWRCFLRGMLIVIPAMIIESAWDAIFHQMDLTGSMKSAGNAFIMAALTEEGLKFLAVYFIMIKTKYYDQFYDGIVYAVFVSLGFALIENILYVWENGMTTALIRGFLSVPGHAFFGVFMGFYLSKAFLGNQTERRKNILLAIVIPILLHGFFDFFLMDATEKGDALPQLVPVYMLLFFVLNIFLWRYGRRKIKEYVALDKRIIDRNGMV